MICTACKKNRANVYIITEVNGKRVEEHLCSECAAKLGKLNEANNMIGFFESSPMRKMFSLMSGGDVSNMAREFFGMQPAAENKQPEELDEITKRRALIAKAIEEERYEDAAVLRDEIKKLSAEKEHIDELKEKLSQAIEEERYEDAAGLRDEIKALLKSGEEKPQQEEE